MLGSRPRRAGVRRRRLPGAGLRPRSRAPEGFARATTPVDRPAAPTWTCSPRRPSPEVLGRKELTVCVVPDAGYGGARQGLCVRHHGFWERAGQAGPRGLAGRPRPRRRSRSPGLRAVVLHAVDAGGRSPFCVNHRSRGRRRAPGHRASSSCSASPTATTASTSGRWAAAGSCKLELQYALQCRHDERQVKTPAAVARAGHRAGRRQPRSASLLDWPTQRLGGFFDASHAARHDQNGQLAFLRYACRSTSRTCTRQRLGGGVPARRLGAAPARDRGPPATAVRRHPQPWLRELAKRFARWRLSIGRSSNQTYIDLQALTRFAGFLRPRRHIDRPRRRRPGRCWSATWPTWPPTRGPSAPAAGTSAR